MRSQTHAFIGLGSNLGDRIAHLRSALVTLTASRGVKVVAASSVYESAAHTAEPGEEQPPYLNAVVELYTTLLPEALLALLHRIEHEAGRERRTRWAPRPLDLDLLLYGDVVGGGPPTLPHPRLAERRFVLAPLADLAPTLTVPGTGRSVAALLAACPDPHPLSRTDLRLMPPSLPESLRYIAVEGVIGAGKTSLARMLAEQAEARLVLEEFEENPFLPDFYRDPERWAFHTQLAFLASRFRQQKGFRVPDLFHPRIVADYTFDKDRIFAHTTLQGDELELYENVYALMEPATAVPDLVVYLRSSVDRLMYNIAQRGRSYERSMERSYIAEVAAAYDHYFTHYTRGALLIVDVAAIDFVSNAEDFLRLVEEIAAASERGGRSVITPPSSLELDFS